jgi:hypothetical protein
MAGRALLLIGLGLLLGAPGRPPAAQAQPDGTVRVFLPQVLREAAPRLTAALTVGGVTHAVAVAGQVAYLGVGLRLVAVDLSEPAALRPLGELGPLPDQPLGLTVAGSVLYVADGLGGLRLFDVSEPGRFAPLGSLATPQRAQRVAVVGQTAYLMIGTAGLWIVDVRNPTRPRRVGQWAASGSAAGLVVRPPYVYVAERGRGLWILDVSQPARPATVGFWLTSDGPDGLALVGRHAVLLDHGELVVVDVASPEAPRGLSRTDLGELQGAAPVEAGGQLYLYQPYAADGNWLKRIDLADPAHPREAARLSLDDLLLGPLAAVGNRLVGGHGWQGGLDVIQLPTPENGGRVLGGLTVDPLGAIGALTGGAGLLYAGTDAGLAVVDTATRPLRRSGLLETPRINHLLAVGRQVYAACAPGLLLVDAGDPLQPALAARAAVDSVVYQLAVGAGLLAAVMLDSGEIESRTTLYDITDSQRPQELGRYDTDYWADVVGLAPDVRQLYVAQSETVCSEGRCPPVIETVSIADPRRPLRTGRLETAKVRNLAVADGYLLALGAFSGLETFGRADPTALRSVSRLRLPGEARSLLYAGRYVFAGMADGIRVIDFGRPTQPVEVGYLRTPAAVDELALEGDVLWVSQGTGGLLGIRLGPWAE